MKTLSVMIRVEPRKWKKLQDKARDQDLTTPQLIRRILDEWLGEDDSEKRGRETVS